MIFSSAGAQVAGRKLPIYCVDRDDNKIALTFDVAWENFKTEQLIDIIDEFDDSLITTVEGIEIKVIRWHLIQMEDRSMSRFKAVERLNLYALIFHQTVRRAKPCTSSDIIPLLILPLVRYSILFSGTPYLSRFSFTATTD